MNPIYQQAADLFTYSQSLRRDLHRHPEMGFHEIRTAGIVARELQNLGLEVSTGIAQTGVVTIIEGNHPGPTVLVRLDMDALPIVEETGVKYASENHGVMHACGHDGHVAVGLTVARLLNASRDLLHGRVKLMFQPAEEGLGGAEAMIAAGVLENPHVDHTLGLHIWNDCPVGSVAVVPGPLMAGAEIFSVKLIGRGGHGALPHQSIDPVLAASQVVVALQSIVARNVPPLQSAVISVTQVLAGDAFNVIPQSALLKGTIRTFEPGIRVIVLKRFREVVESVAQAFNCTAEIDLLRLTPPVVNDQNLSKRLADRVRSDFPDSVLDTQFQSMVSEDMAFVMEKVPGCYLLVGGANPEKHLDFPHHHPKFNFDENALIWASALLTTAVFETLETGLD